jgi:hypothetical protein
MQNTLGEEYHSSCKNPKEVFRLKPKQEIHPSSLIFPGLHLRSYTVPRVALPSNSSAPNISVPMAGAGREETEIVLHHRGLFYVCLYI